MHIAMEQQYGLDQGFTQAIGFPKYRYKEVQWFACFLG